MAFIEISDLNAAGNDLLAGADSFLNELGQTDSRQIFGGRSSRRGGDRRQATTSSSSTSIVIDPPPTHCCCYIAPTHNPGNSGRGGNGRRARR